MQSFLAAALAALLVTAHARTVSAQPGEDPRAVVRQAADAVAGDSAAALEARWAARLARDPSDRAAALGLATLARLAYDYPDAERRYFALADSASPAPADRYAVYALLGVVRGRDERGQPVAIAELLRRARTGARALGDRTAEGEAFVEMATWAAYNSGMDAARAYLDTAARLILPQATDLAAMHRCRSAQVQVFTGQPGAEAALAGALEFARRSGELRAEAVCLRVLSVVLRFRGQMDSAVAVVRAIEDLRRRLRDRSGLAMALMVHADFVRQQAKYGEGIQIMRRALAEADASHNLFIQATGTLTLGSLALMLNDPVAAREHIERAIAAFDAAADTGSLMLARSFRPFVSIAAGDYAQARRQTLEVVSFYERVADWAHVVDLYRQLAAIEIRAGDWAAAERALAQARAASRRHTPPIKAAAITYDFGRLALHRGDFDAAERAFAQYLSALDTSEHLPRYEARARLAEVHARRGRLDQAERELRLAADELDAWRARLPEQELRVLAFQASAFEDNDRNASVATVIGALATGGRADAAFELAERRRARELADRLTKTRALRTGDGGLNSAAHTDTGTAAAAAHDGRRLTAAEVAALLPDDRTALVEYVTGVLGAPTTAFVLTRNDTARAHVRAAVLPPADSLVRQVGRLVALVESGGDARALARALGATLLDPLLAGIDTAVTRLLIVPDGPLHRTPWDALRLADGRYAAERFAIGIAPSAGVMATLWRDRTPGGRAAPRPARLLAFGDPTFPGGRAANGVAAEGETYRSAFDSSGGLPRLRASAGEARLVARYAPEAEVRLREEASAAYLKRARLDAFRVLHFATHALVDERSVARTALALAPGGGESGFVGPGDLAALRLDADLVVLSACRTAGGVVVDGEGVQGLTAPLLQAGARTVVATGWRIGDRSTVPFVDAFYRGLAAGLPAGDALRAAKLDAIRRGAPPREWAAFTLVGDPLVTVPLREPPAAWRRWWPAALIALALAAAAAFAVYSLRTRRGRTGDAT